MEAHFPNITPESYNASSSSSSSSSSPSSRLQLTLPSTDQVLLNQRELYSDQHHAELYSKLHTSHITLRDLRVDLTETVKSVGKVETVVVWAEYINWITDRTKWCRDHQDQVKSETIKNGLQCSLLAHLAEEVNE